MNDQKKLKFDFWDCIWDQNLEKEQIPVPKHPISDTFLNPQPPLGQFSSARCRFAVLGSQQSRTEGKFGKKLRKSCKNVI